MLSTLPVLIALLALSTWLSFSQLQAHKLTIIITNVNNESKLATGNSRTVVLTAQQTAAALITVRNSVRKNMKNFANSNWNPAKRASIYRVSQRK